MGDIEDGFDIGGSGDRANTSDDVKVKIRSTRINREADKGQMDSFVPGTVPVWVKTWGCSHNASDSEYMAGILAKAGYPIVTNQTDATLWVLNSCTVKTPSETQASNLVMRGKDEGKRVIMAGCVSQAAPDEPWLKDISIVGVKQIDRIVEVAEETLKGNTVRLLSRKRPDAGLSLPKMRKNELIEVLAINTGCLNHCTYCKTKMARGDLKSYPLEELVAQARTSFERDGVKELWLTSEDLGAWGRDIGMVLPDLLDELVKVIPDGCRMRLGMTNPPYILDYLEDIARALNHPRVYSFLHIPVQSGSDGVLRDMNREYSCAHFEKVVDYMLENVENVYIATDFICAFPTETQEDFEDSMKLVHKYKFPSLFINQFYPRKGTPAARLKKIDTVEARKRTAAMSAVFRDYTRYGPDRIGMEYEVLVCEMATDGVHAVGHNKSYEHLLVPLVPTLMGGTARVRVTEVAKFHMKTELIEIIRPGPELSAKNGGSTMGSSGLMSCSEETNGGDGEPEKAGESISTSYKKGVSTGGWKISAEAALLAVVFVLIAIFLFRFIGSNKMEKVILLLLLYLSTLVEIGAVVESSVTSGARMVSAVAPWKVRELGRERLKDADGYRLRAAGVCVKGVGEDAMILLVSGGKTTNKWVVPGGGVELNETHEETAIRELEEEAGVKATALETIGVFQDDDRKHRTTVFLMEVHEELDEWLEGSFGRRRTWLSVRDLGDLIKTSQRSFVDAVLHRLSLR